MQEYSAYVSIISPLLNTLKNIYSKHLHRKDTSAASEADDGELLLRVPADQRTANPHAYEPYLFHFGLYKKYMGSMDHGADIQFKKLAAEALFDRNEVEKCMAELTSAIKAQLPGIKRQYLQVITSIDGAAAIFRQRDLHAAGSVDSVRSKKANDDEDFNTYIARHLALDAVTIVAAAVLPSDSALKTFKAFPILNLVAKDAILLQNQIPVRLLDMVLRQRQSCRRWQLRNGNAEISNRYTLHNMLSWYIQDAGVNPFPRSSVNLSESASLSPSSLSSSSTASQSLLAHMYDYLVRADQAPSDVLSVNTRHVAAVDSVTVVVTNGAAHNLPETVAAELDVRRTEKITEPAPAAGVLALPAINPFWNCFNPADYVDGIDDFRDESDGGGSLSGSGGGRLGTVESLPAMPNATDLRRCGIKFRPCSDGKFDDIRFRPETYVLELPTVVINDVTVRFLLNLLAYEATERFPAQCSVVSYVYFMDRLIDTAEDVSLLADSGVILSSLGSHGQVAAAWNKLLVAVTPLVTDKDEKTMADLRKATRIRWRRKWADFKRTYWDDKPWLVISIVVGFLLMVLTILQTVFTVLSYVRP